MKKILLIFPLTCFLIVACKTQKSEYVLTGEWNVTQIENDSISQTEKTPMIGFNDEKRLIYGFTGCNRLTGSFDPHSFSQGKAIFSNLGMTRMMCQDAIYERALYDALKKVVHSEIKGNEMKLKDSDDNVVLVLKKK